MDGEDGCDYDDEQDHQLLAGSEWSEFTLYFLFEAVVKTIVVAV